MDSTSPVISGEWVGSFGRELFGPQQYHLFNYSIKLYPTDLKELVQIQLCLIYTLGRAGSWHNAKFWYSHNLTSLTGRQNCYVVSKPH